MTIKKLFSVTFFAEMLLAPSLALAQVGPIFDENNCELSTTWIPHFCTLCDLLKLVERATNTAFLLLIPFAAIMIIYGGYLIMFAGANAENLKKGRSAIMATLIGIAITLGAWIIVNEVLSMLANGRPSATPWYEIQCNSGTAPGTNDSTAIPDAGTQAPLTTDEKILASDEKALAGFIKDNVACGGTASCGGVNACSTLAAAAAGAPLPVCSSGCNSGTTCQTNTNVRLSMDMLTAIQALKESDKFSFAISSLTTGSHAANSAHYRGKAADFVATGGTTYPQLEQQLKFYNAGRVQCENKVSAVISCNSPASTIGHIHAEFR